MERNSIMKQWQIWKSHSRLIRCGIVAAALGRFASVHGQDTLRYFGGPRISFSLYAAPTSLDLNWDGKSEVRFESGTVCTDGIPGSCRDYLTIVPSAGAELLSATNYLATIPFGTSIGNEAPESVEWTTNGVTVALQTFPEPGEPALQSPFQIARQGYAGVRFNAADGIHYGWIKFTIQDYYPFQPVYFTAGTGNLFPGTIALQPPTGSEIYFVSGPIVNIEEWAIETRPNTPIATGAVPTPATLNVTMGARPGNIRVAWESQLGAAYQVQFKDTVAAATWETVSLQIVATSNTAAADLPVAGNNRFFRIVRAD
jgi:hypothetical protein